MLKWRKSTKKLYKKSASSYHT